jgi:hypothetical protein
MPHPSINLEPNREEICNLYQTDTFPGTIIKLLANQYGIQVWLRRPYTQGPPHYVGYYEAKSYSSVRITIVILEKRKTVVLFYLFRRWSMSLTVTLYPYIENSRI